MSVTPNLLEYEKTRTEFDWRDIYDELDWLDYGGLNMAHEAIDRHANGTLRDKFAMMWTGKNGKRETYTFGQFKDLSNKFANVLKSLGIEKGDRVFLLMESVPELYVAFFGISKVGAIAGLLSPDLGPELVRDRMKQTRAKVLVTHPDLRINITGIIPELFELQHIVIVDKEGSGFFFIDTADLIFEEEMGKAATYFDIVPTRQYDYSLLSYTTGATGKPKGVIHRHQAVVQHYATGKWVLDLHEDDKYWCTLDPTCAMGISCVMVAPWVNGVTQFVCQGTLTAQECYQQMQDRKITVWCTTPTVIQMLMRAGYDLSRQYDLSSLRFVASTGEPLSPETVVWSKEVLGLAVHDAWGQAETGTALCANYASTDIRPGAMGRPIPGIELAVLDGNFNAVPPETDGNLAVRPDWPSMFHTYWNDADTYNSRFRKGWYITGDRTRVDSDGYFWYRGREQGRRDEIRDE